MGRDDFDATALRMVSSVISSELAIGYDCSARVYGVAIQAACYFEYVASERSRVAAQVSMHRDDP